MGPTGWETTDTVMVCMKCEADLPEVVGTLNPHELAPLF